MTAADEPKHVARPALDPAELERLVMLAEECGEVIQAIGKILRHGYESYHPDDPHTSNRDALNREVTDLEAVISMLVSANDLTPVDEVGLNSARSRKRRYAHHQP